MFDNLTERLSGVMKTLRGEARLTENNMQDALREVRMALLEADVALPVIKVFIEQIKQRAIGQEVLDSLSPWASIDWYCAPGTDHHHGRRKSRTQS